MLGHIAIAAMGGCYATQDASGWTDGTYFPTEKVTLVGNIAKRHTLNVGDATYASWFTSTRWWTRQRITVYTYNGYENVLNMRASVNSVAWGCTLVPHTGHLIVYNNRDIEYFTGQANAEFRAAKPSGSNTILVETGTKSFEKDLSGAPPLSSVAVGFSTGSVSTALTTQFWGDLLSNDAHHVYWRRLPMSSVERAGIALFDVDGKELIEY